MNIEVPLNDEIRNNLGNKLCDVYGLIKSIERLSHNKDNAIAKLFVDGFNPEQIWQQIDIHNRSRLKVLASYSKKNLYRKSGIRETKYQNGSSSNTDESEKEEEKEPCSTSVTQTRSRGGMKMNLSDEENPDEKGPPTPSQVDDQFFCMAEMEAFLDQPNETNVQDLDNDRKLIDLVEHDDSTCANYMYEDFFGPRDSVDAQQNSKHYNISKDDDFSAGQTNVLFGANEENCQSSFEKSRHSLQRKIEVIEEENLQPKKWQLIGEVRAEDRHDNELLQEHLGFDNAVKSTPVITQETTEKLEELIKQRLKDKAFDDVERKIKPKDNLRQYCSELVLEQGKSKQSLAEIYEKEYTKQEQIVDTEKKNEKHEFIKQSMSTLFNKLDALTNFHFAPPEAIPSIRLVNNTSSLVLEEVQPTISSDAALLAPQEVKKALIGDLKSREELTSSERKRKRRKKKLLTKAVVEKKRRLTSDGEYQNAKSKRHSQQHQMEKRHSQQHKIATFLP